ncbi:hypothetical protein QE152_g24847 [Popillia japonica]|uniref:MADF domain-containing protein n=1 Tax=Popillia japonica TaxID=7064 RepID=A0AAW1K2E8_POPJA
MNSCDGISTKWQNVRDAFVRPLKKKSGQRKYLYHDQLLFLLKIVNKDQTESSISYTEVASTEISEDVDNGDGAVTTESTPSSSRDSSLIHIQFQEKCPTQNTIVIPSRNFEEA